MNNNFRTELIIPTYKPGTEFAEALRRLALQSFPPDRLTVINTDEAFWNPELERIFPGMTVRHIPKEEFDHGTTRYLAAKASDADILIFMTQDACPADRRLLENLTAPLRRGEAVVSYARQIPKKEADPIERITRDSNYPPQSRIKSKKDLPEMGIKTIFCSNVCAAYDRAYYERLGGFDHPLSFNEDMLFASKVIEAGGSIAYAADAVVIHSHNYTGRQQYVRNYQIGKTQAEHPEVFEKLPSEGEGIRLVKKTASELVRRGKPLQVVRLVWLSGCKYLGYRAGKRSVKKP